MIDEHGSAIAHGFLVSLEADSRDTPGVTRPSYSEVEDRAHGLAAETARALGASVRSDAAGNTYLELTGSEPGPAVYIGSHLDSVPHGGNYDGAAGVAVGLGVIANLAQGARPRRGVVVMGIRAEESAWFAASYVGSRAALGRLAADELDSVRRSDTGGSLRAHLEALGLDADAIIRDAPLLDPRSVAAYIEPHIEQGPVLERMGASIGVVTAIRGSYRHRAAACLGRWDHSGATPREDRADAVVATADLVMRLDARWREALRRGDDVAVTVGQFATDPAMHAFSKIAGRVDFSLDIRSTSPATLRAWETGVKDTVAQLEREHSVTFDLGPRSESRPAALDPVIQGQTTAIAQALGIRSLALPSGAGHDCAVFAGSGVRSGMVFMRSTGGSHNADERLAETDLADGVNVVTALVRSLAS